MQMADELMKTFRISYQGNANEYHDEIHYIPILKSRRLMGPNVGSDMS